MSVDNGNQDPGLQDDNAEKLESAVVAANAGSIAMLDILTLTTGNTVLEEAHEVEAIYAKFFKLPLAQEPKAVKEVSEPGSLDDLTRKELEILALVAEGHSNSQLARILWVTEQTVKFHLSNVYRKLDVANRTEASRLWHLSQNGNGDHDDKPTEKTAPAAASDADLPALPTTVNHESSLEEAIRNMRLVAALFIANKQLLQKIQSDQA